MCIFIFWSFLEKLNLVYSTEALIVHCPKTLGSFAFPKIIPFLGTQNTIQVRGHNRLKKREGGNFRLSEQSTST